MKNKLFAKTILFLFILLFASCSSKQVIIASSATILIKTPGMKFYDKGFITKFKNYTQVQIFSAGNSVLNLKIYENRVCESTFKCQNLNSFNKQYLSQTYKKGFLKELFDKEDKNIVFKDKKNKILIKILRD